MMFPNLYNDPIKPFEIHIYYGSSFNPNEKWVVKGFEGLYGMFRTRMVAIRHARKVAATFLFPQKIYVHSFGSSAPDRWIITTKVGSDANN